MNVNISKELLKDLAEKRLEKIKEKRNNLHLDRCVKEQNRRIKNKKHWLLRWFTHDPNESYDKIAKRLNKNKLGWELNDPRNFYHSDFIFCCSIINLINHDLVFLSDFELSLDDFIILLGVLND